MCPHLSPIAAAGGRSAATAAVQKCLKDEKGLFAGLSAFVAALNRLATELEERVRSGYAIYGHASCTGHVLTCSSLHSSQKSSFKASLDDKIEANLTAWEKHAQATRSELAEAATMRQRLEDTNSVIQSKVGVHAADERLKEGWLSACWLCARSLCRLRSCST